MGSKDLKRLTPVDNTGKKAGFCNAEEETNRQQTRGRLDRREQRAHDSPEYLHEMISWAAFTAIQLRLTVNVVMYHLGLTRRRMIFEGVSKET